MMQGFNADRYFNWRRVRGNFNYGRRDWKSILINCRLSDVLLCFFSNREFDHVLVKNLQELEFLACAAIYTMCEYRKIDYYDFNPEASLDHRTQERENAMRRRLGVTHGFLLPDNWQDSVVGFMEYSKTWYYHEGERVSNFLFRNERVTTPSLRDTDGDVVWITLDIHSYLDLHDYQSQPGNFTRPGRRAIDEIINSTVDINLPP